MQQCSYSSRTGNSEKMKNLRFRNYPKLFFKWPKIFVVRGSGHERPPVGANPTKSRNTQ